MMATNRLFIVRDAQPFQPIHERIIVPWPALSGLLTALHFRFNHPPGTKCLFARYFFALGTNKAVENIVLYYHHCQSLKFIPTHLQSRSTSTPPTAIRMSFAADIMKQDHQLILVLRKTVSSFTMTSIIESKKHDHLWNAILILSTGIQSLCNSAYVARPYMWILLQAPLHCNTRSFFSPMVSS